MAVIKRPKSNSKSVRMCDEVLDYINAAPGDGFNQKFENVVLEAKQTELERLERIAHYDDLIEKKREQLSKIGEKVESLDIAIQAIFSLQDDIHLIQKQIDDIINDS